MVILLMRTDDIYPDLVINVAMILLAISLVDAFIDYNMSQ